MLSSHPQIISSTTHHLSSLCLPIFMCPLLLSCHLSHLIAPPSRTPLSASHALTSCSTSANLMPPSQTFMPPHTLPHSPSKLSPSCHSRLIHARFHVFTPFITYSLLHILPLHSHKNAPRLLSRTASFTSLNLSLISIFHARESHHNTSDEHIPSLSLLIPHSSPSSSHPLPSLLTSFHAFLDWKNICKRKRRSASKEILHQKTSPFTSEGKKIKLSISDFCNLI